MLLQIFWKCNSLHQKKNFFLEKIVELYKWWGRWPIFKKWPFFNFFLFFVILSRYLLRMSKILILRPLKMTLTDILWVSDFICYLMVEVVTDTCIYSSKGVSSASRQGTLFSKFHTFSTSDFSTKMAKNWVFSWKLTFSSKNDRKSQNFRKFFKIRYSRRVSTLGLKHQPDIFRWLSLWHMC